MGKHKKKHGSRNERRAAELGMSLREYKKSSYYKKSKKNKGGGSFYDTIKGILKNTDSFRDPIKPFEEVYNDQLKQEDMAQAEALFKPYFAQQISDTMEDLNVWSEMESIDYKRVLRQGRAKMASMGGAIGKGTSGERQQTEKRVDDEHNRAVANKVRGVERAVGSDNIQQGGFNSFYNNRVGTITDSMNQAIQGQQLWYRNQRADRYYADAKNAYSQPTGQSFYDKFKDIGLTKLKI